MHMGNEATTGDVYLGLPPEEAAVQLTAAVTRLTPPFPWDALPADTVLVGGVIRDVLLGHIKDNPDIDLTVPQGAIHLCQQLASRWGGTVVVLDKVRDIGRLIHGSWTMDVAAWDSPTIEPDLWRRDFALNAMAYHLRHKTFHDPCGGLQDLAQRRLRCVAAANLVADPVRILRAYRLAAELGCTIEERTRQWLQQEAPKLAMVASERVLAELERLCRAPQAHHWLLEVSSVLQAWLPMLQPWPSVGYLSPQLATTLVLEEDSLIRHLALARLSGILGSQSVVERLGCSRRQQCQWKQLNHWRQVWAKSAKEAMQNPKSSPQWAPAFQSYQAFSKARDQARVVLQRFPKSMMGLTEDQKLQLHLDMKKDLPALLLVLLAENQLTFKAARLWLWRWQDPADTLCHPRCPLSGHRLQQALSLSPSPQLGALMAFLRHENAFGRLVVHDEASILAKAQQWLRQRNNVL